MTLEPETSALMERWRTTGRDGSARPAGIAAMVVAETPVQPVHAVEDRHIPGPGGDLPVRIYRPSARRSLPVLLALHGGGWVGGSIELYDHVCRWWAADAECVVVSVGYRLAPQHRFPAALEDTYAAACWVHEHAAEIGGDPARIAIAGSSAGGNLAAAAALMARDRDGPPLVFQLLIYPATDAGDADRSITVPDGALGPERVREIWNTYLDRPEDRTNPYASPSRATDLGGLPPALIITAEYDPLCDEGEAYGHALRSADVPATVTRYDGTIHGFYTMAHALAAGRAARAEAAAALRSAFQAANAAG